MAPVLRRVWYGHVDRWTESKIRIKKPTRSDTVRDTITLHACNKIERAACNYDGSEQRRWTAERVAICLAARHGGRALLCSPAVRVRIGAHSGPCRYRIGMAGAWRVVTVWPVSASEQAPRPPHQFRC